MRRLLVAFVLTLLLISSFAVVGGRGAVSYLTGFVVLGYLTWRAWPAVSRDLAGVSRHLAPSAARPGRRQDR
jgi:hypothetical protein